MSLTEEFQAKNNFDRAETLSTVFLGISLTCARCHNHKFDPIPQTEYYRLLAFFNSTAENSMDGNSYVDCLDSVASFWLLGHMHKTFLGSSNFIRRIKPHLLM